MDKLKKNYEFQEVFSYRRRKESENFYYHWKPAESFSVGIVASKKTGNAVERHKIKRRIINTIQEDKTNYTYKIVIRAKNKITASFLVIQKEILKTLKKIQKEIDENNYQRI